MTTTTAQAPTAPARPFRLSRRMRQAVLVLHIVSAVGWIGVDLALIPLVLTGLTTDDGPTAAAAYRAVAVFVPWTVPALSLLIVTALEVTDATTGDEVRAAFDDPAMFLYPPVVSGLLLTTSVVLSVVKPQWRVERRRGAAREHRGRARTGWRPAVSGSARAPYPDCAECRGA